MMAFLITNKHQSKANERGSLKKHICTAILSIFSAQASCSLLSMLSAQASCSQNFVQAQDQLRPLNGSVHLILKNGVHETNLSLDPTKWMNFIMLVIDISCTTMHCG